MKSKLEEMMSIQIKASDLPEPTREYRFHPTRRWRFDFFWPEFQLALEVDGGVYNRGRHTTGKGYTGDCEKMNEATCMGIAILRITSKHIGDGSALKWLEVALNGRGYISKRSRSDQLGSEKG